ncbi:MAG: hypothetical protein ACP6IQ_04565 [Candidatus Njordarchaeia archaeon]
MSTKFNFPSKTRYILIFITLSVVGYMLNITEYIFFSRVSLIDQYGEVILTNLTYIIIAFLISVLFPQQREQVISDSLKEFFVDHSKLWYAYRVILSGIAYFAIYFLFGTLVAPFVLP